MKSILIIEDEDELREGIAEILTFEGFNVLQAANGFEGLQQSFLHKPDLILCDILMPDMSGYKVLEKSKENDQLIGVPFIFITALTERQNFRLGMDLGADDYLTKPFTRDELLNAITSRLNKNSRQIEFIRSNFEEIDNELNANIHRLEEEIATQRNDLSAISEENTELKQKIVEKECELMKDALKVVEINNTLHNIRQVVADELQKTDLTDGQKKILFDIKNKLQNKSILINNLTVFQLRFNQANPGLAARFSQQFPNLTQYELVIISTVILGLNTKQIANMLNISEESVRKSKYRLKKKIGLSKEDNFLDFIYSVI